MSHVWGFLWTPVSWSDTPCLILTEPGVRLPASKFQWPSCLCTIHFWIYRIHLSAPSFSCGCLGLELRSHCLASTLIPYTISLAPNLGQLKSREWGWIDGSVVNRILAKNPSSVPGNHIKKLTGVCTSSSRRSGMSGVYGNLNLYILTHSHTHN